MLTPFAAKVLAVLLAIGTISLATLKARDVLLPPPSGHEGHEAVIALSKTDADDLRREMKDLGERMTTMSTQLNAMGEKFVGLSVRLARIEGREDARIPTARSSIGQ